MAVFQLHENSIGPNGKAYGFCFDGRGRRMITSREPIIIGIACIQTIKNPVLAHWEPIDEDAA